jgi:hypothetical protein
MRQESILLAFVEAVYFVNKHDGAFAPLPLPDAGLLDRFADVLDTAQHGRNGDEMRVKTARHQTRNGGLANARRTPKNAAVRLARLERNAQRHALTQQMLLAYDFAQVPGAQAFGQWRVGMGC